MPDGAHIRKWIHNYFPRFIAFGQPPFQSFAQTSISRIACKHALLLSEPYFLPASNLRSLSVIRILRFDLPFYISTLAFSGFKAPLREMDQSRKHDFIISLMMSPLGPAASSSRLPLRLRHFRTVSRSREKADVVWPIIPMQSAYRPKNL